MIKHNKQSLLILLIYLFSFKNSCPMDAVIEVGNYPTNHLNDCIISMHDYWEHDYAHNINAVKNIDVIEMITHLQDAQYLPDNVSSLEHLLYLSTIQKGDTIKTPFSQKQQDKFNTAWYTRNKVYAYFIFNGVVIACTSLFGYTNFVALSQCVQTNKTDCVSQMSVLAIPATITCTGALLVGFTSLYATGILPDVSARKADKVQDKIGNLSSKYLTLAKYWIDIYFMYPDKAIDIAKRFDMDTLQARIKLKTRNAKSGEKLVGPLKEAWHFIMHKHILITFTEIENYLYSKMNAQNIVLLCKRINDLEKTVQEKDTQLRELVQRT